MHKIIPSILFIFLLGLLLLSGTSCHWILPYEPYTEETWNPYFCTAQIYRDLDGNIEFTEEWEYYTWSNSASDAITDCDSKISKYIENYMAPDFTWNYRNLTALNIVKEQAVDCSYPIPPPTYGAPFGAELRWNYPPATQAYAYISLIDKNGNNRVAEPSIANAYVDFAERAGLPDWSDGGTYVLGKRNIRFSDFFIELDVPFNLGTDLKITKFYVQSIGTIIGEREYESGTEYKIYPGNAKFFMYAHGEKDGEGGTTSLCFINEITANVTVYQGPPYAFFALALNLNIKLPDIENINVKVSLSKPTASPSFSTHQPFVALTNKAGTSPVTLTADIIYDHDDNLDKYLWFENFESPNEIFLGQGNPLENVYFNSSGERNVTVVAYDTYGAYNSSEMTLAVNIAPVAINDSYSVDEDCILNVDPPGVLGNDQDDDPLTAIKVSDPNNGTLMFNSDGSFTYTSIKNWYGTDSFTYKANDGIVDSNIATVTITVNEVSDQDELIRIIEGVEELEQDGTLNQGQANSLIVKLNQAIEQLNKGKSTKIVCNLLQSFINEVQSFIDETILTPEQGQALIDYANNLMQELQCY